MNQPELALEQFVAALAIEEDPRIYNGMGVVHDMNGSHDSAQDNYRSGLNLAPNDTNLRNNLALSLALAGKYDEGIQILGRLVNEAGANTRHRQNLSLIYGLAGRPADAARVARLDFDEPTVQNNLAYYETLRAMPARERAAAVFGINVVAAPSSLRAKPEPAAARTTQTPSSVASSSEQVSRKAID
jgi:Flp pilus assembly protein TadD